MSYSPNKPFIGNNFIELDSTESTNQFAIEFLSKNRPIEGTVISAISQRNGKGQYGSNWESESGKNINLSVILYPTFLPLDKPFYLSMCVSLGARDLLAKYIDDQLLIKWPNDLLINGAKICGILIQNTITGKQISSTVLGIGVNINQRSFLKYTVPATSLSILTGNEFSLEIIRKQLFARLDFYYNLLTLRKYQDIKQLYLSHLLGFQRRRKYEIENNKIIDGKVIDVLDNGLMQLETQYGPKLFNLKEIKYII